MSTDVFISYQHLDQAWADSIYQALEQRGFTCWMASRQIPPGEEWPALIVEAIRNSRRMVLLLSSNSRAHRQIAREVEIADREGIKIITVRIEDVQPPAAIAYFLQNIQWLDAFKQNFDAVISNLSARLAPSEAAESSGTRVEPTGPIRHKRPLITRLSAALAMVLLAAIVSALWMFNRSNVSPPASKNQNHQSPQISVLLSDNFARANADACDLGRVEFTPAGVTPYYYMPIFRDGARLVSKGLQNGGLDFGGVQIAQSPSVCVPNKSPSALFPPDLRIWLDVLVPSDSQDHISRAGPYFWSRRAAPFDGIIGGSSAGYWVQLLSTGEVIIKALNPLAIMARSGRPSSFDSRSVHSLALVIRNEELQVVLDGGLVSFFQADNAVTTVKIPRMIGQNDGTVGVAFSAEDNRGKIGGQRVTKLVISNYSPLGDRPLRPPGAL